MDGFTIGTATTIGVSLLVGAATWSLMEYLIHRFAGHRWRANIFGREHTRHHSEGNYFAPTYKKLLAAVVVLGAAAPLATWIVGPVIGPAWAGGLVVFYLFYEWLHRRAHTHAPRNAYGRWVRRHHFWHHYGDPRTNHGVTSPIWDVVFRTRREPGQIRVPRKLAMQWLFDESGDVAAPFRADYTLRGGAAGR